MNTTMNKLALERSFVASRLKIYAHNFTKLSFNITDITNRKNLINKIKNEHRTTKKKQQSLLNLTKFQKLN